MIVRLGALLGFWPAVWIKKLNGEVFLRIAHRDGFGWHIYTHGSFIGKEEILPGGKPGNEYLALLSEWKEWKHNMRHVVF